MLPMNMERFEATEIGTAETQNDIVLGKETSGISLEKAGLTPASFEPNLLTPKINIKLRNKMREIAQGSMVMATKIQELFKLVEEFKNVKDLKGAHEALSLAELYDSEISGPNDSARINRVGELISNFKEPNKN